MKNILKDSPWVLAAGVAVLLTAGSALAVIRELTVTKTNYADRWITNNVEVTMPRNIIVEKFRTNHVPVYHTNTVEVVITNSIQTYQTNVVQAWSTNLKAIWLTNFSTVLVLQTNWVKQTATNIVQLEMPTPAAAEVRNEPAIPNGQFVVEASWTPKRATSMHLPVRLRAKDGLGSEGLTIAGWRVQSQDGTIMSFGQDTEFKRELPPGRYSVEVTAQRGSGKPMKCKSTLIVGEQQATIVSQPLAAR